MNELISNALKYAFDGRSNGLLYVVIREDNHVLHLSISDNGIGKSNSVPKGETFGTELVQSFIDQLDAQMRTIVKNGTTIEISIPLKAA
jgi:two-component sensor histidine kinase